MRPQTLDLHPAPAAPAPAPSQIRYPDLPDPRRRSDLPLPGSAKGKLMLFGSLKEQISSDEARTQRQEYPTWLH